MTGEDNMEFRSIGENINACKGAVNCSVGKKAITVAGGKVDILGLPSDTKTWVNLYGVEGGTLHQPTAIIVEADSVKNNWVKGAEILITSHTRIWNEHQQRTIEEVKDATEAGYIELVLNIPIIHPTTNQESPEFAVEVALLSRNIVFEGGDDQNGLHGGHFMIMHTPNVIQSIIGLDVRNFGQQGTLGRYPIHFHFSGDVSGSVVAKNTIRHSHQRCVVVHGTNQLRVEDNVAFDTAGHCYMVGEDGIEQNNHFFRNLGAQTKAIPEEDVIPDDGFNGQETDHEPATFWIPNPTNSLIENVAAGSENSGFWFEPKLRGTRAHLYPDYDPKAEPLILFKNNVIHSSGNNTKTGALRMYSPGYRPRETATFDGLKSYRNDNSGIQLHRCANLVVSNAIFSDNNIGIDLDRTTDIVVRNSEIIGESDSYRRLMERQDVDDVGRFNKVVGFDLHTWKVLDYGAFTIKNIELSGFDRDIVAVNNAYIINMDDHNIEDGQFEMYTSFENLTIRDGKTINFCELEESNIDTAYLVDIDGSLSPRLAPTTSTSTLLSNGDNIMKFVEPTKCTAMTEGCYNYCQNTCFRSVRFTTDGDFMQGYTLKVCERDDPSKCSLFAGASRGGDRDPRTFIAHLPVGSLYDAVFLNTQKQEVEPTDGIYMLGESFCPTGSQFGVDFAGGPSLMDSSEVNPVGSEGVGDPIGPEDEEESFFSQNWFRVFIKALLNFLFGSFFGGGG